MGGRGQRLFDNPRPAPRWPAVSGLAAVLGGLLATVIPLVLVTANGAFSSLASAAQGAEQKKDREVEIVWAGDITPGSRYGLPPEGGRALFKQVVEPLRLADLAIGNLEGTLSTGGASKCGSDGGQCFSFQAPPANASALRWAGFDVLNLANNHANDFGEEGQRQTMEALHAQKLDFTGPPGRVSLVRRHGVRIAVVGFAPYRWASELRNIPLARKTVADAAKRADLVVVLMHAGGEGTAAAHVPPGRELALGEDRGETRAFSHAVVEAGADLVLGSGPHVLRGMELYRGKLIAYSLGNFAGWNNFSRSGVLASSGLLRVRLSREGNLHGGRLLSLHLAGPGVPVPDKNRAAVSMVNQLGKADFGGTALRVLPKGYF